MPMRAQVLDKHRQMKIRMWRRWAWVMLVVGDVLFLGGVVEQWVLISAIGLSATLAGWAWLWELSGEWAEIRRGGL